MEKFPIFGSGAQMPEGVKIDDKQLKRIEAMIQSMTPRERAIPAEINESRRARIARGAGVKLDDVKDLIERFNMMQGMMQQLGNAPGLLAQLPGFKQIAQMQKLRGMNPADLFGKMGMPKGMPGMPGMPAGMPAGLPPGFTPPGFAGARAPQRPSAHQIKDKKAKRKAQKQARKKGRR
jgi:signal recognition particle subunit SRP54